VTITEKLEQLIIMGSYFLVTFKSHEQKKF
jgi:hypothetical protein